MIRPALVTLLLLLAHPFVFAQQTNPVDRKVTNPLTDTGTPGWAFASGAAITVPATITKPARALRLRKAGDMSRLLDTPGAARVFQGDLPHPTGNLQAIAGLTGRRAGIRSDSPGSQTWNGLAGWPPAA